MKYLFGGGAPHDLGPTGAGRGAIRDEAGDVVHHDAGSTALLEDGQRGPAPAARIQANALHGLAPVACSDRARIADPDAGPGGASPQGKTDLLDVRPEGRGSQLRRSRTGHDVCVEKPVTLMPGKSVPEGRCMPDGLADGDPSCDGPELEVLRE